MENGFSDCLIALLPAIKSRWEILLSAELNAARSSKGVITPKMLTLMLDGTLARLLVRVNAYDPSTVLDRPQKSGRKKQTDISSRCGLHLVAGYYLAGVRALRAVLPRDLHEDRVRVCHCLNLLAHEEIEGLVSLGHLRGSKTCSPQPVTAAALT